MCDERERLIEYIYGEVGHDDRRRLDMHLTDCHACRTEVAALRQVRDDLLAWDVPKHEAVWRPAAPERPVPFWRTMPAWGLAAAASLIFTLGAAGGVVTRMWLPEMGGTTSLQADAEPTVVHEPIVATVEDLARLEETILQRVRVEMDEQMRASAGQSPQLAHVATSAPIGADVDDLSDRLAAIEQWKDDQIMLNAIFNGQFGRLNSRTNNLTEQVELSRMLRAVYEAGGR